MRKWLVPGEQVIVITRPHARKLALPAIIAILLPTALGIGLAWLSRAYWGPQWDSWRPASQFVAVALTIVVLLFFSLRRYLKWFATSYILTSRRIVIRKGALTRGQTDIPLFSLRTFNVSQGVAQRMRRCGNITLISGVGESVVIREVPEVTKFKNLTLDAIEELPHSALLGEEHMPWEPGQMSPVQLAGEGERGRDSNGR